MVYPAAFPVQDKNLECNVLRAVERNGVAASIPAPDSPAEDTVTHVTIRVEDLFWGGHLLKTTSLIHFL